MKESTRVFRFALIGTLNALLTAGIIWFMMHYLDSEYKVANITGYLIAQFNNFFWCKYWIYVSEESKKGNIFFQFIKFSTSCLLAYLVQFVFIYLLIDLLGCNPYLGQFLGLFVYGASNFLFNRFISFR